MNKTTQDLEFERNRMEILKAAGRPVGYGINEDRKFAWELELEEYRNRKKRERWYLAGAMCGVLSLILNLVLNWKALLNLLPF